MLIALQKNAFFCRCNFPVQSPAKVGFHLSSSKTPSTIWVWQSEKKHVSSLRCKGNYIANSQECWPSAGLSCAEVRGPVSTYTSSWWLDGSFAGKHHSMYFRQTAKPIKCHSSFFQWKEVANPTFPRGLATLQSNLFGKTSWHCRSSTWGPPQEFQPSEGEETQPPPGCIRGADICLCQI